MRAPKNCSQNSLAPLALTSDPWQEAATIYEFLWRRRRVPCPGCRTRGSFALPSFVAPRKPPVVFRGVCRVCRGVGFFK